MSTFKFSLGKQVSIKVSGEAGEIIGRAEYANRESGYFVNYKSADGRAVKDWWDESALQERTVIQCDMCRDTGKYRVPYGDNYVECEYCDAARPSSTASATTEASDGSPDLPGGSTK